MPDSFRALVPGRQDVFELRKLMEICCPRCGGLAEPAGHEDARAFFQCPACNRVWATHLSALLGRPPAHARPRVLVADDSPEMLGLLAAWLEDEGCVVIAVGSGREALDAAAVHRPDAAFIDVVLPPPDGFQLCEMLVGRGTPAVVLMTGMSNPDQERATAAGALLMLQKPFPREVVLEALALALQRRKSDESGPVAAAM